MKCIRLLALTAALLVATVAAALAASELMLPTDLRKIESEGFRGDMSLEVVVIPDGCESIGSYAFAGCGRLVRATIPASVTSIGEHAFMDCDGLTIRCEAGSAACDYALANGIPVEIDGAVDSGSVDGLTWYLTDGDELIIAGNGVVPGAPASGETDARPWHGYSARISRITLVEGVTGIGERAFYEYKVRSVTLPDTLKSIGAYAFCYSSLRGDLVIPDSVTEVGKYAFAYCYLDSVKLSSGMKIIPECCFNGGTKGSGQLNRVEIPEGIEEIGAGAFACTRMTEVVLPSTIRTIGASAFYWCYPLKSINIPESVTSIEAGAFSECGLKNIMLPEGLTTIGQYAFGRTGLPSVRIPGSVTDMTKAFKWDYYDDYHKNLDLPSNQLRSVKIESGVTAISESAFEGSHSLTRVELPETLKRIEKKAFRDCRTLELMTLPNCVEYIGEQAFADCTRLVNIVLPATVNEIDDTAFENCPHLTISAPEGSYARQWAQAHGLLEKEPSPLSDFTYSIADGKCEITGYTGQDANIVIPNRIEDTLVTGIAANVFMHQTAESITLPFALQSIGDQAFGNCGGLTQMDIPVTVKTIGNGAFNGCGSLTSLALYEGLETIGDSAFAGCASLLRMEVPDSVTELGSDFINGDMALTYLKLGGGVKELSFEQTRLYTGSSRSRGEFDALDPALETVVIAEGVTSIGPDLFSENSFYTSGNVWLFYNCAYPNLTTVSLPEKSLLTIGEGAFEATALTQITIPNTVTEIGSAAFRNCTALAKVSILRYFSRVQTIGSAAFSGCTALGNVALPEALTTLGDEAFYNCDAMTEVTVPANVTTVGEGAFRGCDLLAGITLKEGLTRIGRVAFAECPALERMEVPDSVTELGDDFINGDMALKYLKLGSGVSELTYSKTRLYSADSWSYSNGYKTANPALETVVIGEGVTSIGAHMFSGEHYCVPNSNHYFYNNCTYPNLKSVSLPESLETIGEGAFAEATSLAGIVIPPNVTDIGVSAFEGCTALASVNIPAGVTAIEASTFRGCTVLGDMALPTGLMTIGNNAFNDCDGLENMEIPQSVTAIGESAFAGCDGLAGITLKEGLTHIGRVAFANCASLERMEVPDSVTELGDDFINGDMALTYLKLGGGVPELTYSKTRLYSGSGGNSNGYKNANPALETVVIGEGVTSIGPSLFSGDCYCIPNSNHYIYNNCNYPNLKSVSLPESLEVIGDGAFASASSLTDFNIPANTVSIGESAFRDCPGPRQLILPDTLAGVEANAFNGCTNVETLVVQGEYTAVGAASFANETSLREVRTGSRNIKDSHYMNDTNLGSVTFTGTVKTIGAHAFDGCANLESLTFEKGVAKLATIGEYAFNGCAQLTAFPFAEATKLITVGNYAFAGCASMTKLTLHNVETIGDRAFYNCAALEQVALPLTSLRTIGERAFAGLTELETLRIPESVYYVGARVVEGDTQLKRLSIQGGGVVDSNTYWIASAGACALEELDIGGKASVIENNAFSGWTSLKEVHLSEGIIWIGDNAFSGCANVNAPNEYGNQTLTLSLPGGLIYLGSGAFNGCDYWTSGQQIVVPYNVTALKANTFAGCKGITRLILSSKVETIEESAFKNSQGVRLYVPSGSAAAQWCQEHYAAGTSTWSYYAYGSESSYYGTTQAAVNVKLTGINVTGERQFANTNYTATFNASESIQGVRITMLRAGAPGIELGEYAVGQDGVSATQVDGGYTWTVVFVPTDGGVQSDNYKASFLFEAIDWSGNYCGTPVRSAEVTVRPPLEVSIGNNQEYANDLINRKIFNDQTCIDILNDGFKVLFLIEGCGEEQGARAANSTAIHSGALGVVVGVNEEGFAEIQYENACCTTIPDQPKGNSSYCRDYNVGGWIPTMVSGTWQLTYWNHPSESWGVLASDGKKKYGAMKVLNGGKAVPVYRWNDAEKQFYRDSSEGINVHARSFSYVSSSSYASVGCQLIGPKDQAEYLKFGKMMGVFPQSATTMRRRIDHGGRAGIIVVDRDSPAAAENLISIYGESGYRLICGR